MQNTNLLLTRAEGCVLSCHSPSFSLINRTSYHICFCRRIWECLGDAYIARGSYMAAMKAFQRALEVIKFVY